MGSKKDLCGLPDGWIEELAGKADLERSYAALRGIKHFLAEGWRGRIRSEQLRFDSAWKHFDKAYELADEVEENIPNLVRQFILNIWCFENALAEAPLAENLSDLPMAWIPELPEEVLKEYPEVRLVIQLRKRSEALLRLHMGQYTDAAEIYEALLEETRARPGEEYVNITTCYIGLAACDHNLGFEDKARTNLENAGLMVASSGDLLSRIKFAALLYAFYSFLEEREQASNWEAFIQRLECPQATKDVVRKRAAIVIARCSEKTSMIPIF